MEVYRIFCNFCKKDSKCKSEFEKNGSINIQISALSDHAKSKAHRLAAYMCDANTIHVDDTFEKSRDKVELASLHLFAAAYYVAKNDLSFCSFPLVLELLLFTGCSSISIDTYHNDKACAMFVHYINESLFQ